MTERKRNALFYFLFLIPIICLITAFPFYSFAEEDKSGNLLTLDSSSPGADSLDQENNLASVEHTTIPSVKAGGTTIDVTKAPYNVKVGLESAAAANTKALNQALEDASKQAGITTVVVPKGNYYFNDTLYIYSNTTLKLAGGEFISTKTTDGAMLQARHRNTDGSICYGNSAACTHGGYTQVKNVTIDGGGTLWHPKASSPKVVSYGLALRHGEDITIKNLSFKFFTDHAINISGVNKGFIQNVTVSDSVVYTGTSKVYTRKTEDMQERKNFIEAIHLDAMTEIGEPGGFPYDATSCKNITVTKCTFNKVNAGVGNHHTQGNPSSGVKITNCVFNNIEHACINLYNSSSPTVSGNSVSGAGTLFCIAYNSSSPTISGNTVSNTGQNAINLYGKTSNAVVKDNKIISPGEAGVVVSPEATAKEVSGNSIENAQVNGISIGGSGAKVDIVKDNTITNAAKVGIAIFNGGAASISSNTVKGGETGISVTMNCKNVSITGNTVSNASKNGIGIGDGSSATVSKNTVTNSADSGVAIFGASTATIDSNIISGGKTGLAVTEKSTSNIKGNTLSGFSTNGIGIGSGSTSTITENSITCLAAANGIAAFTKGSVTTDANTIEGGKTGIVLNDANTSTLKNDVIKDSGANGVAIMGGDTHTVTNASITKPKQAGIYVKATKNVTLKDNTISSAGTHGISQDTGKIIAEGNTIRSSAIHGISVQNPSVGSKIINNIVDKSSNAGIYAITGKVNLLIEGNKVTESVGNGIHAQGVNNSQPCDATINKNTSTSSAKSNRDIYISSNCNTAKVTNNILGTRGLSGDKASKYTDVNNKNTPTPTPTLTIQKIWHRADGTLNGGKLGGRYDTMADIVKEGWKQTGGSVVIATGKGFKDALAAAGLAGLDRAPVILTDGNTLSSQAQAQLKRLKPSKVYIAGGELAISKGVKTSIDKLTGVTSKRLFGSTSSGTSAQLANAGQGRWKDSTAIIATNKSFKDALSVAPVAYALGYPILLADGGKSLSQEVLASLKTNGITNVIIVGGKLAVTNNVEKQLKAAKISIKKRLAGDNGVETSQKIAKWALNNGLGVNGMGVATSQNFPDALAGAALCGYNKAVLVLADDKASLNATFPADYKDQIYKAYVFGGEVAVGKKTFSTLEAATK